MPTADLIEQLVCAFNSRREDDEHWAVNARRVAPGGAELDGRDVVPALLRVFHIAYSGGHLTNGRPIIQGNRAAVEGTFTGTHDGPRASPHGSVLATGRSVDFRWAALYDTDSPTLAAGHLIFDQANFLAQLGRA